MSEIPEPIRVLIADRSPIVREGLRVVLKRCPDIQLVGEATDGEETIQKTVHLNPDVLLLEPALPNVDGVALLRSIQTWAPQTRTILFASTENRDEFIEALKLGCAGVLFKHAAPALIEKSIQRVHAGELWLDSFTTTALIRQFARSSEPLVSARRNRKSNASARLTRRERQVVSWIACGAKTKRLLKESPRKSRP